MARSKSGAPVRPRRRGRRWSGRRHARRRLSPVHRRGAAPSAFTLLSDPLSRPLSQPSSHRRRPPMERRSGSARTGRSRATIIGAGAGPVGRRRSPHRGGPGHRSGGLGQDPGPHRATSSPDRRPAGASEHDHGAGLQQQGRRRPEAALRGHSRGTGTQYPHPEQPRVLDLQRIRSGRPPTRAGGGRRARPAAAPHRNPPAVQYGHRGSLPRGSLGHPARTDPAVRGRRSHSRRGGHCGGVRHLPFGPGGPRCRRFRRADLPGHRDPPDRCRRPGAGPVQLPPPAGGRVPGPQPGSPAAHPAAGRPVVRLLRGG